ncbi:MAG: hypothetical protein C3F17_18385 [Bradyrhizobiaceae bacterium]|nr:MAG: hypothetical protein C3F17_18385 [Bradyrhizobiaceae bacterium]
MSQPTSSPQAAAPIDGADDAQALVVHLLTLMDAMLRTVEEETALVRAGKLGDAAGLEPRKSELARRYLADTNRLKANAGALTRHVPELVDALRRQHESFQAILQMNLAVLATAHAVSEGLIRGAAAEAARETAPQTYGRSGRTNTPSRNLHLPVSLNRTT